MSIYYWIYMVANHVCIWAADKQWEHDKRRLGIKE
jgi:hypothetical protein